jgi:hypothetical protein
MEWMASRLSWCGGELSLRRHGWQVAGALALVAALALGLSARTQLTGRTAGGAPLAAAAGHSYARQGLLGLPAAARAQIAAQLGSDLRAFTVSSRDGVISAGNPAQRVRGTFSLGGADFAAGPLHVGFSLLSVGFGSALTPLAPVAPAPHGNRVTYARPGLDEWYANGPLGIEQGFTVARPRVAAAGPLTLALSLSGGARARRGRDESVTFSRAGRSLAYGGLAASDANGRPLHTWLVLDRSQLLLRVDARGARWPVRIDPFIQQGPHQTEGPGAEDFAATIALSADGNTALVGMPSFFTSGAYVFVRSGSTWTQQGGLLQGSGAGEHSESGQVALSADGNTALLGGPGAQAAWVFTRSGSTWSEQAKLTGTGEVGAAAFGDSVAVSGDGNTAVVGGAADNSNTGAVWTFTRSGQTWTQVGEKLVAPTPGHAFGRVALSSNGETLLVGDITSSTSEGGAWVYVREGEAWREQAHLTEAGGLNVALSGDGNTAMIGAEDFVSVYTRSGETWTAGQRLKPSYVDGPEFPFAVALSRNGQVALLSDAGNESENGAVFVFDRSGETWTQQQERLVRTEVGLKSDFGAGLALSEDGSTALIGGFGRESVWAFTNVPYAPPEGAPEFGECGHVNAGTGKWGTAACSSAGTGGDNYEWFPGARVKELRVLSGAASLSPIGSSSVACKGWRASGEFTGYKSVGATIGLTECSMAEQPCTTPGMPSGHLQSAPLEGALGVIRKNAEAKKNTVGLDFAPASGPWVEFTCGSTSVTVRGSVVASTTANGTTKPTLKFAASKGKQSPQRFEGQPVDILEASVNGGAYAKVGLVMSGTLDPGPNESLPTNVEVSTVN